MSIDWGGLRRADPISREFGYNRGSPIDRYYIDQFLSSHTADIAGRVLEVGDDTYTRRFGSDAVSKCDILHVSESSPVATIIGDLADENTIPEGVFDCAIITQTLHLIFEPQIAVRNLHRGLRNGGVLLATAPGITPVSTDEWKDTWFWSFTRHSVQRIFDDIFGAHAIELICYGNLFAATCFLQGIALEEVTHFGVGCTRSEFRRPHLCSCT